MKMEIKCQKCGLLRAPSNVPIELEPFCYWCKLGEGFNALIETLKNEKQKELK